VELSPHWIEWGNWDVGLRILPDSVSRKRECICPELSRNKNIGALGINMHAEWFNRSFTRLAWAAEPVHDFGDLSYLLQSNYTAYMRQQLAAAIPWTLNHSDAIVQPGQTYLLTFSKEEWPTVAARLNLWQEGSMRGMFQYMAIIPWKGATFLVADRQMCALLTAKSGIAL